MDNSQFCPGVPVNKGITIVLSYLFRSYWLAVVYCLVFCIGSCVRVHKDRTQQSSLNVIVADSTNELIWQHVFKCCSELAMLSKPSESCDELCNIFPFKAIPAMEFGFGEKWLSSFSKISFKPTSPGFWGCNKSRINLYVLLPQTLNRIACCFFSSSNHVEKYCSSLFTY